MNKNDRMKEHLGNVGNILLLVGPEKRETKTSGKMGEDIWICIISPLRQAEINKRNQTKGRKKWRHGFNLCYSSCYSSGESVQQGSLPLLDEASEQSVRSARSPSCGQFCNWPPPCCCLLCPWTLSALSITHTELSTSTWFPKCRESAFLSTTRNICCCWETSFPFGHHCPPIYVAILAWTFQHSFHSILL